MPLWKHGFFLVNLCVFCKEMMTNMPPEWVQNVCWVKKVVNALHKKILLLAITVEYPRNETRSDVSLVHYGSMKRLLLLLINTILHHIYILTSKLRVWHKSFHVTKVPINQAQTNML